MISKEMILKEMIQITDQLPSKGSFSNGFKFEIDVSKNGKLGYIARLWEVIGLGVKERVLFYGTGSSPDKAKESLKKKLLK